MADRRRIDVRSDDQAAMPPVEEWWKRDVIPPPPEVFERAIRTDLGTAPQPKDVFLSPAVHDLEVERLWKRVWQVACREQAVAFPGDYATYDIADQSVVIVRDGDNTLRAFHNVCMHRGTRLVEGSGSIGAGGSFQCTFHAWMWRTDGSLAHVPCRWDFPEVHEDTHGLHAVSVDAFDGWVFVNLDPGAPPLAEFLGDVLPRHFALWPLADRFVAAHVAKVQPANWKIVTAAFIETYHVVGTHPDSLPYAYDAGAQYDQYGPHVARMVQLVGVTSPHLPQHAYTDQDIVDALIGGQLAALNDAEAEVPLLAPDQTARSVLADFNRAQLGASSGLDMSQTSDAEVLDVLEYFVFPNFVPWGGYSFPLVYRFRPHGNDPEACLMEVMLLVPFSGERPPDAPLEVLAPGTPWSAAPQLGGLGPILDQDDVNIRKIQLGLHSDAIDAVSYSRYQESNVRLLHATLADYVARA